MFLRFDGEDGKIQYVHTLTVCIEPHCGFPELIEYVSPPSQEYFEDVFNGKDSKIHRKEAFYCDRLTC